MSKRITASSLGFIKDSEGVYRRGKFIFRDGKIIRESNIVPSNDLKEIKDNYTTMGECIRSVLAFPASIGEMPRTSDVYIDKVGNNYKPAKQFSKNTVAVVTSQRQVIEIKAKDVTEQTDINALENKDKEDKPANPKEIKDFSKPEDLEAKTKKELKESALGVDKEAFIKKLYATNTPYEVLNLVVTDLPDGDLKDEAVSSWVYYKDRNRDMDVYHDLIADLLDTMEMNPNWHKDRINKEINK